MSDLISRQNAIKAIRSTVAQYVPFLKGVNETLPMECEIALRSVPSAEPKTGKWINRSMNICYPEWERYTCSECGKHSYIYDYCPNCGARMTPYKGGEEE